MSDPLTKLLRANLSKVQRPGSYGALREMLVNSKPSHEPPIIKESPENNRRAESSADRGSSSRRP
jgi:hypothetical protein